MRNTHSSCKTAQLLIDHFYVSHNLIYRLLEPTPFPESCPPSSVHSALSAIYRAVPHIWWQARGSSTCLQAHSALLTLHRYSGTPGSMAKEVFLIMSRTDLIRGARPFGMHSLGNYRPNWREAMEFYAVSTYRLRILKSSVYPPRDCRHQH